MNLARHRGANIHPHTCIRMYIHVTPTLHLHIRAAESLPSDSESRDSPHRRAWVFPQKSNHFATLCYTVKCSSWLGHRHHDQFVPCVMQKAKAKATSHTRIIAGVRTRNEKKLAIEKKDGRDNRIVTRGALRRSYGLLVCSCVHMFVSYA